MTIQCKVKSIKPLASNTYQILLHPETPVAFKAGQYLMVVMGEKDKRPSRSQVVHAVMKVNLNFILVRRSTMLMHLRWSKRCKTR